LARVLTLYYQEYAKAIPSGRIVPEHMRIWLEFWQAATLAEMTLDRQVQFRAWLATERRYANSTIKRILTTGAAAVNRAWKTGIIRYPVKIIEVEGSTEAKEPRGRALTPGEIAKLFDAIEQEPLFRYCLILLATYCRAEPPHDLRGAGLDFRHRLIFLNPRGRPQNKKYRPTVKMPWFIAEHFAGIGPDDYLLTGTPTPVKDLKKGFYLAVERAGLEGKVTRTSFRHTGGRWLRAQGVKPWEAGAQLGHRKVYGSTTETYAPYDPAYLDSALCAIEQLFDAVRAESVSLQARFGEESKVVRLR
jgi:integrase